jgi:GGDEF domain-containing protein
VFAAPFALEGHPDGLRVTASIGVALAQAGCSAEELLCDADVAMYSAKYGGSTCARYEPGMHQALKGRSMIFRPSSRSSNASANV